MKDIKQRNKLFPAQLEIYMSVVRTIILLILLL